ncbi:unnamed protein product [Rotaria socialis]|uniref:Uncharacterized protein n=1 Tax=Rotaria socialis TaxID=392032 RepID=A0A818SZH5_9BILA|nr:unnamed protein product [Rotaria socialis]
MMMSHFSIVNGLISIPAMFSMGMFYEHSINVSQAVVNFNSFKRNRSNIFQYIMVNCSQLLHEYPQFYIFPHVDLCTNYNLSLMIGKMAVLLSTLFNTYLPYGLYGPPLIPVIIMAVASSLLFYTNFTNNEWDIAVLESLSIVAGYLLIIFHYAFPNFDQRLSAIYIQVKQSHVMKTA